MIRPTLQSCIDLFNSNIIMQSTAIRGMEQLGEYEVARTYWIKIGRNIDATACKIIADAISKGDSFRSAVNHLNIWVDETVENGIMTKDEAVKVIYPEMSRIYKQYYN